MLDANNDAIHGGWYYDWITTTTTGRIKRESKAVVEFGTGRQLVDWIYPVPVPERGVQAEVYDSLRGCWGGEKVGWACGNLQFLVLQQPGARGTETCQKSMKQTGTGSVSGCVARADNDDMTIAGAAGH